MNVRHPMSVLHSFPIKNIFMIKWTWANLFLFDEMINCMTCSQLTVFSFDEKSVYHLAITS